MARRVKIGFIFWYDTYWIAGPYYVLNIIRSLNTLPDAEKPEISIISNKTDFKVVEETQYPYLNHFDKNKDHPLPLYKRIAKKVLKNFCDISRFDKIIDVDIIFPIIYTKDPYLEDIIRNIPSVYWIPDFQELYMPELFKAEDLQFRIDNCKTISKGKNPVVFSSNTVLNDYNRNYPNNTTNHIYQFAVFHPEINDIDIKKLFSQKNIPLKYFFCANQFWQHKNHTVIFKALKELKSIQDDIVVVFSGNENDNRNTEYIAQLKAYIIEHNLQDNIRFLGFIDRKEQLVFLANALAVIQPSLFEGWSTVVEDCKAQNQFLLLSDIPVHKEQIHKNVLFFDPHSSSDLANIMANIWNNEPQKDSFYYSEIQERTGIYFKSIINKILQ